MKLGFRERKGNGNEGIWGIWGNSIQTLIVAFHFCVRTGRGGRRIGLLPEVVGCNKTMRKINLGINFE